MERALAQIASPPRLATRVGVGVGLGACALALAGAGLVVGADGGTSGPSVLLVGASLLCAAAAGFAVVRRREVVKPFAVLGQAEVFELLGAAGDGVWDYDLRTGKIDYSPTCATMLGYAADELTSTLSHWGTLVHEDDLPGARQALDDYLEGRTDHYRVQVRMRRKDGGWTKVLDCGRVVARDERGRAQRACGIHRAVPASAESHDVAAAVSSDLDQALAGLLGQATLASNPGEGAELERAAWRCVGLANRLKLAAGEESEAPVATDVVAVTRSIVADAEQWSPQRVSFRVRSEAGVQTEVLCKGVFQSLLRLGVDDAVERTDLGGGSVEVRLSKDLHLVASIAVTQPGQATGGGGDTKRMRALRGLAARHGVKVSRIPGGLQLAWVR